MQNDCEPGPQPGMEPGCQDAEEHYAKQTSDGAVVQLVQPSMQTIGQKRMSPVDSEMQCPANERKRMDTLFAAIDVTEAANAQQGQNGTNCVTEMQQSLLKLQDSIDGHVAKRARVDATNQNVSQQHDPTSSSFQQTTQPSPKSQVLCSLAAVKQHADMASTVVDGNQHMPVSNGECPHNGPVNNDNNNSSKGPAPPSQPLARPSVLGCAIPSHNQTTLPTTPTGRTESAPNPINTEIRPAVSMNHSTGATTMSQDRAMKGQRTASSVQRFHDGLPPSAILPPASLQIKQTSNGLLIHTLGALPRSASDDESGNSQHTTLRMVPGQLGSAGTTPQAATPKTIASNNDSMAQRVYMGQQVAPGMQVLYPPHRVGQTGPDLATQQNPGQQGGLPVVQPPHGQQHVSVAARPGSVQHGVTSTPSPVHTPAGHVSQAGAGQTVVLVQRPDGKGMQLVQLTQQQMQQLQGQNILQQAATRNPVIQQQHVYAGMMQPQGATLAAPPQLQSQTMTQQLRFSEPAQLSNGMQVRTSMTQSLPGTVTHESPMQYVQQPHQQLQPFGQAPLLQEHLVVTSDGRLMRLPISATTQAVPHGADTNNMHTIMHHQPVTSGSSQYVLQQPLQPQVVQHHGVSVSGMVPVSGASMQQHVRLGTSLNSSAPMPQGSNPGLSRPVTNMHWQQQLGTSVRPLGSSNGVAPQQVYAVNAHGELVPVSQQMPARVSHGLTAVQGPLQSRQDTLPLHAPVQTTINQQPTLSSGSPHHPQAPALSRQGTVSSASDVAGLQPPAGMQVVQLGRPGELAVVPAGGNGTVPDRSQNLVISMARVVTQGEIDRALKEVLEVMMHKPRGRPVKYIDVGVNRMALKYHVGIKLSGRVESMGATDTELAAHMLLDMVKIGLGLYVDAAAAAAPAPGTHPEEQMTSTLAYHPSNYSTGVVQRVIAQLINRNLIATSELSHAYTRATRAGCVPGPCYMSVASALSAFC